MTSGVHFFAFISVETVLRKEMSEKNFSRSSCIPWLEQTDLMKIFNCLFATPVERGFFDFGFMKRKSSCVAPSMSTLHFAKATNLVAAQKKSAFFEEDRAGTYVSKGPLLVLVLLLSKNIFRFRME